MWRSIFFVGAIMAVGTLFILDASLPGGLVSGSGDLRFAQTMAFTTLVLFQLFAVFTTRSADRSAFEGLGTNRWLWLAVVVSVLLQVVVVYAPFLQRAFSTVALGAQDWLLCFGVASSVLWVSELAKVLIRYRRRMHRDVGAPSGTV
jgi:Ca2+-transporting ATPase